MGVAPEYESPGSPAAAPVPSRRGGRGHGMTSGSRLRTAVLLLSIVGLQAPCPAAEIQPGRAPATGPLLAALPAGTAAADAKCEPLLRHSFNSLQAGTPQSLCQYEGKVLLIVNTASYCGYTPQYEGLEALYRKYRDRGLVVLGFPSNDFGAQEPGSNKEVAEFCRTTYGVEFPMFEKSSVARLDRHPLYSELAAKSGKAPQWNFHKYLVDRSGRRVQSFGSDVKPDQAEFVRQVEKLLAESPNPR